MINKVVDFLFAGRTVERANPAAFQFPCGLTTAALRSAGVRKALIPL
jgi:hypothetical protein